MKKFLLPISLLAGCFTLDAWVDLREDGSGTMELTVNMPYLGEGDSSVLDTQEALRRMGARPGVKLVTMSTELDTENAMAQVRALYEFKSVEGLFRGTDFAVRFTYDREADPRVFRATVRARGTTADVKPKGTTPEDSLEAAMESLTNMLLLAASFNLAVRVPGEIVSQNGDSVKEGVVFWSSPFYVDTAFESPGERTLTLRFRP